VAAVLLSGSGGRGEADEWSDVDLYVVSIEEEATVLSCPSEAERFGDLAVWVDCAFNAPIGGTQAFSRYLVPEGLVMVDWNAWPLAQARLTTGSRLLWARAGVELEPYDGNLVELTLAGPRRHPPPYSRQQRAEWELCMCHIAMSRPARRLDASTMCALIGVAGEIGTEPAEQLDAIARHLRALAPWIAPRLYAASLGRLEAVSKAVR
jgi:hypothetical protein